MKELKELFSKIKPEKLSGQEQDLYEGIIKNDWTTDQEALKYFWPDNDYGQRYLWGLKNRVFGKLVTSILRQAGTSSYQSAYIECWREFAAVQVLRGMNLKRSALWMAERLLKKSLRYEQTEISVSIANFLEINAGRHDGSTRKRNEYFQLGTEQENILAQERKANRYFLDVTANFSTSQNIQNELSTKIAEYAHLLEKDFENVKSYRFALIYFRMKCLHAQVLDNNPKLITICNEALQFFQNKDYPIPRSVLFGFTFKPIQAAIKMKDYPAAINYINIASEIDPDGSHNHNACLLYKTIVGFHSDDSILVIDAIEESKGHRKYAPIAEQWTIIEAYAAVLGIEADKFKLGKFLNQMPIFSKDKRGHNISILIVQMLHYLKEGKRGKIIDRVEALKLYTLRYLKKDENFRSNCFIKMLLCLPKGNFHPVAVERYAKQYRDRMGDYAGSEIEVVPYERLWEKVVYSLSTSTK